MRLAIVVASLFIQDGLRNTTESLYDDPTMRMVAIIFLIFFIMDVIELIKRN